MRSQKTLKLRLFLYLCLAGASASACGSTEEGNSLSDARDSSAPCIDGQNFQCAVEAAIFRGVNTLRAQNGVASLIYDGRIGFVSRDWSRTMMSGAQPLSHNGFPSERNRVLQSRFSDYSDIMLRSENVAYFSGFTMDNAEQVASRLMNQWANSAGHRTNMLNPNWVIMGAGMTSDSTSVYGTQIFGTFANP